MEFRLAWERLAILDYRLGPDVLKSSWLRCQRKGIPRGLEQPLRFKDPDPRLDCRLADFWPVAQHMAQIFGDPTLFVLVCDMHGSVVEGVGSRAINRLWEGSGLARRAVLAEDSAGTNAVALALRHNRPVALLPQEHWCYFWKSSVVAVPFRCRDSAYDVRPLGVVAALLPAQEQESRLAMFAQSLAGVLQRFLISPAEDPRGEGTADNLLTSSCHDGPVPTGKGAARMPVRLSARQMEVLRHLSYGYSCNAIAKALGISPETVRTFIRQIYNRFGVCSKSECLKKAYGLGLLSH